MTSLSKATVTIDGLAYGGDAVSHMDGRVVFIPGGVPGDVAHIEVLKDRDRFVRGELKELVVPSPDRVEPFCPNALRCGGCQWQAIAYPLQVRWKRTIVEETLRRIGGFDHMDVDSCLASPVDRCYRTVARYPVLRTAQGIVIGYYEHRSHEIVDITSCPVAEQRVNDIASVIRKLLNERFPRLDVRELTIRAAHNHPSSLVSMTLGEDGECSECAGALCAEIKDLAGVSFWILDNHDTSRHIHTAGDRHRYEIAGGKVFRIEERSFFQVNIPQTEQLIKIASEMAEIEHGEKVIDGYGGVGLFSLSLSHPETDIVLFDVSGPAVRDSIHNARQMGFSRFKAIQDRAKTAFETAGKADVVIIDPPRTGLGLEVVKAACYTEPRTIVYISCNPATLARDLKIFHEHGYAVGRVVPLDMFPHTFHIETVVQLKRLQ